MKNCYLSVDEIGKKIDFGEGNAGVLGAAVAVGTLQNIRKGPNVGVDK